MPVHGNFDKIIHQQLARAKENSKYKMLKRLEQSMEPLPKNRPRVLMEEDKKEYDYPETRKYNYVRPNSKDEDKVRAPDAQERHFPRSELALPKRKFTRIDEEWNDQRFEPLDPMTPEEQFDRDARTKGQTHEGNKTLHRGKQRRRNR
jgi:hypothetical protein